MISTEIFKNILKNTIASDEVEGKCIHTTALQQYRSTFVAEEIRCDIFHYNITVLGYLIQKKLTITVGSQTNLFQNSNINLKNERTNLFCLVVLLFRGPGWFEY